MTGAAAATVATTEPPAVVVVGRWATQHLPKWQRFQTPLITPSHYQQQSQPKSQSQSKSSSSSSSKPKQPTTNAAVGATAVYPYQRQYSHVYHQRLLQLAPYCRRAFHEWQTNNCANSKTAPMVQPVQRLLELQEGVVSFVVATVVKEGCTNDGNDNTNDDNDDAAPPPLVEGTECRATDALCLEDESGRVAVAFAAAAKEGHPPPAADLHEFCTGMVVGMMGTVNASGTLLVEQVFFPHRTTPSPPKSLPLSSSSSSALSSTTKAPHLLLLSGLDFGGRPDSSARQLWLQRDLLLQFLEGRLGHGAAPLISRIIVCGGLVSSSTTASSTKKKNGNGNSSHAPKSTTSSSSSTMTTIMTTALLDLDAFFFQITAGLGLPVDVLPGADDPTTAHWPQRPLHSSLVRQSHQFGLLHRTTNPYHCRHGCRRRVTETKEPDNDDNDNNNKDHCHVICTDGTNVRDLQKHILARRPRRNRNDPGKKEPNEDETLNPLSTTTTTTSAAMEEEEEEETPEREKNDQETNHDDYEYTQLSELQALQTLLQVGHLCPTGPASVPTMPHVHTDPMVLSPSSSTTTTATATWPHVLVAGNCTRFATTSVATTTVTTTQTKDKDPNSADQPDDDDDDDFCRLICVPSFATTGEAVLLNLQTRRIEVLRFAPPPPTSSS